MKSQPTSSAALVAANEAKAWDWSCRPNRKEEHVKLDLAAYRVNIAGVPTCRSFRCNDDKTDRAREGALVGVYNLLPIQLLRCSSRVVARLQAINSGWRATSTLKCLHGCLRLFAYVSYISTGIVYAACLSDNLIARAAIVLQHAPGCRTDTHNAQLCQLYRCVEIRNLLLQRESR